MELCSVAVALVHPQTMRAYPETMKARPVAWKKKAAALARPAVLETRLPAWLAPAAIPQRILRLRSRPGAQDS
jgi:hypothetical protein